ncbi:MAG TPA: hypothetical protein VMV05_11600 [bacterium]|nr:hypothetical protein [bacterium]
MGFKIRPKLVIFFLAGFGFGALGPFPNTCYSDVPFPPAKQTPTPQYAVEMRTVYPADQKEPKKISIIFVKGSKELWTRIEPYPMLKAVVIQETGRSFLKLGDANIVELRVYSKKGDVLLDKKVLPRAVSFDGNFIAYENPMRSKSGLVTTLVYDLNHKTTKRFKLAAGFQGMALSCDGKDLLVGNQGTGPSGSNFRLLDEHGDKIWERNGPERFLALGNKGKWLLWTNQGKKTVECRDFNTGKVVREFSMTIFNMLYKQLAEIRSF